MTGTVHTKNPSYSRLTFALLEDTGWYKPNYEFVSLHTSKIINYQIKTAFCSILNESGICGTIPILRQQNNWAELYL